MIWRIEGDGSHGSRAEKTYGGSNISLQLLCKKATPA
jgi:hypothetical protein